MTRRNPHKSKAATTISYLYAAIISFIVFAIGQGIFQAAGLDIFTITLTIWAWSELQRDDLSGFRRLIAWAALGSLAILLFVVMNGMLSGK